MSAISRADTAPAIVPSDVGAKDTQQIIIVRINVESEMNTDDIGTARTLNHESEAHIVLDPTNSKSQETNHRAYRGSVNKDQDALPGTPAYNFERELQGQKNGEEK